MAISLNSARLDPNVTEADIVSIEIDGEAAIHGSEALQVNGQTQELIVLDPEHPLMKRFQDSLSKLLLKYIDKCEQDIKCTSDELKAKKEDQIRVGNELYQMQQELLKNQVEIEKNGSELVKKKEGNEELHKQVESLRHKWESLTKNLQTLSSKCMTKRSELEKINLKILVLNKAKGSLHSDVVTMKNAATKIISQLNKLESSKLEQDLILDSLQEHIDQLNSEIAIYEAQIETQKLEYENNQAMLTEIEAEIIHVKADKKNLVGQWNNSLNILRSRNETYTKISEEYQKKLNYLRKLESEHQSIRKSIENEQKEHEKLTAVFNRNECQVAILKKQNMQTQNKFEAAKQEYSTYSRMLQETESALAQLTQDQISKKNRLESLRKTYEIECQNKLELEKKIAEELQKRLLTEKSIKYVEKLATNLLDTNRDYEMKIAELENKLAVEMLEHSKVEVDKENVEKQIDEVNQEIANRNQMVTRMEQELKAGEVTIGKREVMIDTLNRKIGELKQNSGELELSPLEIKIMEVTDQLAKKQEEVSKMEKDWLRNQSELVKYMELREESQSQVKILQKRYATMEQRRIRFDKNIESLEGELSKMRRNCENLHSTITRMNANINKHKEQADVLKNAKYVEEMNFFRKLKEKEVETEDMQQKLQNLKKEKENLMNELREVMQWEKKVQLAEEAKESVNSQIGDSDMKDMKMEIQRMELKRKGLLREQEFLTQALEKTVQKREILLDKNESNKSKKNKNESRETVRKEINQLKSKITATEKDIKMRNEQVEQLTIETQQLYEKLNLIKSQCQAKQEEINECSETLTNLAFQKHLSLLNLHLSQQELTMWRSFSEGRFRPIFTTKKNCLTEINKQTTRILALMSILDGVVKEHPKLKPDLEPLKMALEAKQALLDGYEEQPSSSSHSSHDNATPVSDNQSQEERPITELPTEKTLIPSDPDDELDEKQP